MLRVSRYGVAGLLAVAGSFLLSPTTAEDAKAKKTKVGEISLLVPESWKAGEPSSKFRLAQFDIPPAEGDEQPGEYVVFYFGKGGGGGVDANVTRWIGQFQAKELKSKSFTGTSEQGKYTLVDLTGTYNQPIGPPIQMKTKPMPGARMLGVVLQTEETGDYFIKFTGPEKTVAAAAEDFRKSFGGDASKEKEIKKETK